MRYGITERGEDVEIRLRQTGGHTPRLLASFQDCQQGRCGCPTDQYDRLENMTVHTGADDLAIQLRPRAGERLDIGQLQECLDYTIAEAERDTD